MVVVAAAFLLLSVGPSAAFLRRQYVREDANLYAPPGADVGEPLFITKVREARGAAAARYVLWQ